MSAEMDREIIRLLKQCRELLWMCFAGILIMVIILFYADIVKADEFTTEDYYIYQDHVDENNLGRHYRHHYGNYYADDCCPDRDREREKDREDRRQERWDEQQKNILREQGVDERMLVW